MLIKVSEILAGKGLDQNCVVRGWVRSVRKSKKFSFVVISDGSSQDNFQMIIDQDADDYENISTMLTGTSIEALGSKRIRQGVYAEDADKVSQKIGDQHFVS